MIDTLNISSITPCFIAGADNSNLELDLLRPPSLKGVMRWWFRVISRSSLNLKDLHEVESMIFGSTSNISPIHLQIVPDKIITRSSMKDLDEFNYLWHPLYRNQNLNKNFIDVNSSFQIRLVFNKKYLPKELREHPDLVKRIWYHCLWLSFYLGGIGMKSRRGAGSFLVDKLENEISEKKNLPKFKIEVKNQKNGLAFYYQRQFRKLYKDLDDLFSILGLKTHKYDRNQCKSFAIVNKKTKLIIIDGYSSWVDALDDLEDHWKDFRGSVKNSFGENFLGCLGRPVITPKKADYIIKGRFSSPFYFSIKRYSNENRYFITNVNSGASFKEYGVKIRRPRRETVHIKSNKVPTIIKAWIRYFKKPGQFTNKKKNIINL